MSDERSTPEIGILLGSKSDLALVKKVEDVFSYFGVTWEISVASAHRTPEDVARYASRARERGIRVLVAAAGLSAALPGVVAAHTTLPVIGIPVNAGSVGGIDRPPCCGPDATRRSRRIGGNRRVKNAALFAVRILAFTGRISRPGSENGLKRKRKGSAR
jgi:5-(carboxyamino)imidazole ribonucleotide mutase